MSLNTFYLEVSNKPNGEKTETLIVANNVIFCESGKVQTLIHLLDGTILYTDQSLKFINKLLTREYTHSRGDKNE